MNSLTLRDDPGLTVPGNISTCGYWIQLLRGEWRDFLPVACCGRMISFLSPAASNAKTRGGLRQSSARSLSPIRCHVPSDYVCTMGMLKIPLFSGSAEHD